MPNNQSDKLQTLLDWERQLHEELVELQAKRNELNEEIGRKETQVRNLRELLEIEGLPVRDDRNKAASLNCSVADAAYQLINEVGQPLYYKDIAERLMDTGVAIPGRDPQANLLSYIVRDHRFQRTGRGTYALLEWGLRPKLAKKGSLGRKKVKSRTLRAT